jgi:hypothetical protein
MQFSTKKQMKEFTQTVDKANVKKCLTKWKTKKIMKSVTNGEVSKKLKKGG